MSADVVVGTAGRPRPRSGLVDAPGATVGAGSGAGVSTRRQWRALATGRLASCLQLCDAPIHGVEGAVILDR